LSIGRSVALNLRISSDETRRLGVDYHICELLLVLTTFSGAADFDVHQRYMIVRNCRDAPYIYKFLTRQAIWILRLLLSSRKRAASMVPAAEALVRGARDIEGSRLSMDNSAASRPYSKSDGPPTARSFASVQEECSHMMELCINRALTAARRQRHWVFGKDRLVVQALEQAGLSSVWDDTHPFTAALFKPWTPFVVSAYILYILADFAVTVYMVAEDRRVLARHFRFTALETRDPSRGVRGPGISGLGVVRKQDRPLTLLAPVDRRAVSNASHTISFAEPVWMNGWWFETSFGPAGDDPVRFRLDSSLDGVVWSQVGSSGVVWTWGGSLWWTDGVYSTGLDRGLRVDFDAGLPWVWSAPHLAAAIVSLAPCLAIWHASWGRCGGAGKVITVIALAATSVVRLAQFGVCLGVAQRPMAWSALVQAVVLLLSSAVLWFRESLLLHWLVLAGLVLIGNVYAHHTALVGDQGHGGLHGQFAAIANDGLVAGVVLICAALPGFYLRWSTRYWSAAAAAEDTRRHETCWAEVMREDEPRGLLQTLERRVREIVAIKRITRRPLRQRIRPEIPDFKPLGHSAQVVFLNPWTRLGSTDVRVPMHDSFKDIREVRVAVSDGVLSEGLLVHSMDQLFAQAAVADVLLRDRLPEWACVSGGMARLLSDSEGVQSFVPWSELMGETGVQLRHQVIFDLQIRSFLACQSWMSECMVGV